MFKLIALFALLAAAFAAPKADPILPLTYAAGAPLAYSAYNSAPIAYNYGYAPAAATNYYHQLPLAYNRPLYY